MSAEQEALADIARSRTEWLARLGEGDLDGYLAVLTADVVWLPPRGPALAGAAALRAWLSTFLAQYRYDFTLSDVRIRVAGDRAFERGAYRSALTPTAGGVPMVYVGRYALLRRRDPDGRWRIERYADDTDLSPADGGAGDESRPRHPMSR